MLDSKLAQVIFGIYPNGKLYNSSDELCIFPSKDQRDWNKWFKAQNSIIKTFNDLQCSDKCIPYGCAIDNNYYDKCYLKTEEPIEKSAFALFVIYQLIEFGYGGNITNEEWTSLKYIYQIEYNVHTHTFMVINSIPMRFLNHIVFHTKKQAEEPYRTQSGYQIGDKPDWWESDCASFLPLDKNLFPDLTWDDDPIEVEIVIKRKKK